MILHQVSTCSVCHSLSKATREQMRQSSSHSSDLLEISIKLLDIQKTRSYTVLRRSLCQERQGDMPCYVALKEQTPFHTSKAGPHEPALPHVGTDASPVFILCRTCRTRLRQGIRLPLSYTYTTHSMHALPLTHIRYTYDNCRE